MAEAPLTLPSPLAGYIHPISWVRPAGNYDFKVTKTAAQHALTGPPALDFGDRQADHDNIYAVLGGKVILQRSFDGTIGIESSDGNSRVFTVHAVLNPLFYSFAKGKAVSVGTVISQVGGTYGSTGFPDHLHLEVHRKVNGVWVKVDPWPLLAFNQYAVLNGGGSNLRTGPGTNYPIYATAGSDGIYKAGVKIAPLTQRMRVQQAPFAVGSGLVWVKANLLGKTVYIWKNLVHFDL